MLEVDYNNLHVSCLGIETMAKRVQRRPREWDYLMPHVCQYCGRRFYNDVFRYLFHIRHHELRIRPYWYDYKSTVVYVPIPKIRKTRRSVLRRKMLLQRKREARQRNDDKATMTYRYEQSKQVNRKCHDGKKTSTNTKESSKLKNLYDRQLNDQISGKDHVSRSPQSEPVSISQSTQVKRKCQDGRKTSMNTKASSKLKNFDDTQLNDQISGQDHVSRSPQSEPVSISQSTQVKRKCQDGKKTSTITKGSADISKVKKQSNSELKDRISGKDHVSCSSQSEPVSISSCKKVVASSTSLKCKFCNKVFSRPSKLEVHEHTHTKEKPFKCKICNKGFSQGSHLTTHTYIHTKKKPFKCKLCGNGFSVSHHLKNHERIHTEENLCTFLTSNDRNLDHIREDAHN
ncbi:uncharacterized protein [Amphiura filiformis]|uniref:uncharacterized protein n=1 Tax=Amphiura filiformis TaxID=82378 RepID=UPI003B21867B